MPNTLAMAMALDNAQRHGKSNGKSHAEKRGSKTRNPRDSKNASSTKKAGHDKGEGKRAGVCHKWQLPGESSCTYGDKCKFSHRCEHCGGMHKGCKCTKTANAATVGG
mgnify:CR=1 FL=1